MQSHQVAFLLLLGSLLCLSFGHSSARHSGRSSYFNEPALARSNDGNVAVALEQGADKDKLNGGGGAAATVAAGGIAPGVSGSAAGNKDASSGRLFLKKFLMFKNMFSSNNQPVIPIIITGAGSGTTSTSPTSPTTSPSQIVTSTGTLPTATGTVNTSPAASTSPTTPTATTTAAGDNGRQYAPDDEMADDANESEVQGQSANAELVDEQALQAALAAGAQEYEVYTEPSEQSESGATESKATPSNRINLRRKGGRRGQGQMISVRIPPRYRRYFKNGQKVMLNTKSRPNKRRVIRRRVQTTKRRRFNNRRRGGKNKNKKGKGKGKNKNKNRRPRIPVV